MTYEKALSLWKNDKTLQILRAEHFPLLVSFFHLAFKQQDRISYRQSEISAMLGDFLYALEKSDVEEYSRPPLDYLQKWAGQNYLRRYYDVEDEPLYELSPSTEAALKWLEDLNRQQFVGTHSRLLQFFSLLQQIVNQTAGPEERIAQLEKDRARINEEIAQIKAGNVSSPSGTQLREQYYLAEETARRLLADFRQVEENFRALDFQTRQTIIKTDLAKAELLDDVFSQQDHLWNTDQGRSFRSFWEFLMSEQMQGELDGLIEKLNSIPSIREIKKEQTVDRIKFNLVEAGDKVNRSNDGLIAQIRKFVELKTLSESKHILRSIEAIEALLIAHKDDLDPRETIMALDGLPQPKLVMERPLFSPPAKVSFDPDSVEDGEADAVAKSLFDQFFIDIDLLRGNLRTMLREKPQASLAEVLSRYHPERGVAEVLGYVQIATSDHRHYVNHEQAEDFLVQYSAAGTKYLMKAPLIIFNR